MSFSSNIRHAVNLHNDSVNRLGGMRSQVEDNHRAGCQLKKIIAFFQARVHQTIDTQPTTVLPSENTYNTGYHNSTSTPTVNLLILSCIPVVTVSSRDVTGRTNQRLDEIFDCYFVFGPQDLLSGQQQQQQTNRFSFSNQDHIYKETAVTTCCLGVCLFNLALARHVGCLDNQAPEGDVHKIATLYESAYFLLTRLSALQENSINHNHNDPQVPQDPFLSLVCFACCTNLASLYLEWGNLPRVAYWKHSVMQIPQNLLVSTMNYHAEAFQIRSSLLPTSQARAQGNYVTTTTDNELERQNDRLRRALQCIHCCALVHGYYAAHAA